LEAQDVDGTKACDGGLDGRTLKLWHYEAPNSAMGQPVFFLVFQRTLTRGIAVGAVR